jgi:hypothetical protein
MQLVASRSERGIGGENGPGTIEMIRVLDLEV